MFSGILRTSLLRLTSGQKPRALISSQTWKQTRFILQERPLTEKMNMMMFSQRCLFSSFSRL